MSNPEGRFETYKSKVNQDADGIAALFHSRIGFWVGAVFIVGVIGCGLYAWVTSW